MIQELKRVTTEEGCIIFGVNNNNNNLKRLVIQKFSKYMSILKDNDLQIKPFWALPSCNTPYYSGEIYNNITSKAFFKNIDTFISILTGGKPQSKIKRLIPTTNKSI